MALRALLLSSILFTACAPAPTPAKCPELPASPPTAAPPAPPVRVGPASPTEVTVSAGDFAVTVRATAFGNLAYQLDCLADLIHCSTDAIRPFWTAGWTKDDDDALAAWKRVRAMYKVDTELAGKVPPALVPLPHGNVEVDKQLRIASMLANTPDELRANLRVLMPPQDAEPLVTSAEHFRPRFDAWWSASGGAIAARFASGLAALFGHQELADVVTRAARFYAAPLAKGTPIDFDLVVLPGKSEWTSGEQMLAHGVIEVLADEKPEARMDVVCHELFHFFFNARTPDQQASLAARFTSSPDPLAVIAYYLLDESVATALGNGVVDHVVNPMDYAKRSKRELGFYGNHAIDATAKGLLARTKEDPTLGPPLDSPELVSALLAAARDAVGEDPRPIEYLHTYAAESDEGWWDETMKVTGRAANSNNEHRSSPFDGGEAVTMVTSHPALSAVLLVPRARLGALSAYGDAIPKDVRSAVAREAARSKKAGTPFAYVAKRSPQARLFVIVADDVKGAKSVADALFAQPKSVLGVFHPSP